MSGQVSDRNLLFGILALQMDFITRDALIAAMNDWVLAKHRPIGEIFLDRGDLNSKRQILLDSLVDEHIEGHGNVAKSLAGIGIGKSTRKELGEIGDPQVDATLTLAGLGMSEIDPDRTTSAWPGSIIELSEDREYQYSSFVISIRCMYFK